MEEGWVAKVHGILDCMCASFQAFTHRCGPVDP